VARNPSQWQPAALPTTVAIRCIPPTAMGAGRSQPQFYDSGKLTFEL